MDGEADIKMTLKGCGFGQGPCCSKQGSVAALLKAVMDLRFP
jgi:hypothetical protein